MEITKSIAPFTVTHVGDKPGQIRVFNFSSMSGAIGHLRKYVAPFTVDSISVEVRGEDESVQEECVNKDMAIASLMVLYANFWDIIQDQRDHVMADMDYDERGNDDWCYDYDDAR